MISTAHRTVPGTAPSERGSLDFVDCRWLVGRLGPFPLFLSLVGIHSSMNALFPRGSKRQTRHFQLDFTTEMSLQCPRLALTLGVPCVGLKAGGDTRF